MKIFFIVPHVQENRVWLKQFMRMKIHSKFKNLGKQDKLRNVIC